MDGPRVERAEAFLRAYPESALLLPVCEVLSATWCERGDRLKSMKAASRGLKAAPDYAPLLVELVDLSSNGSEDLDRAERAAVRAVGRLQARAHAALGMVWFKRDDMEGAIREFEASIAAAPVADAATHYRRGRIYTVSGRPADARRHLELAAHGKDGALAALARSALAGLP
jgi:tetratricopeptide (TPR) repeat protein